MAQGWVFPSYHTDRQLKILIVVEKNDEKKYVGTGPLLNNQVFIEDAENGFSFVLDKELLPFVWINVWVGSALYRPFQRVVAETWIKSE